ncbi:Aldose 1-epimerase [bacterium HR10]|nr:Aldose 1-epimerase [bacterium HR10]
MRVQVFLLVLLLAGPVGGSDRRGSAMVRKEFFGRTPEGEVVDLYTLTNSRGMEVKITNYGGIVVALRVPDRQGRLEDVVLGFDRLEDYLKGHPYFGAIIGRYANRIAGGRFTLNGVSYQLTLNEGQNHLHGGRRGFDKVVWKARPVRSAWGVGVRLTYLSRDGEEGYPGNLSVTVTYLLTEENELRIEYVATTDRDTIVNLTHHSYFNLAGQGRRDILEHLLQINAEYFTPIDANLIPTGEIRFVRGTPFDFTRPTAIGARIEQEDEQLRFGRGYDHNWVLSGPPGTLRLAARVVEPGSGRVLEVWTTEPGLQFYSGNFLDGTITGKEGRVYRHRYGFCLEPQHFPDSPNKPHFPSVVLRRGARYHTTTVYKFSVQ